ncbi:hypothetical protein GZ77_01640 [Endozoicomonas montiporae]|uniref:Uncharacterized protein n=2 Tax=Endozoicomonas montiporae TaxID=1027273 RepID=A0A081NAA4_9GAMM|nr:hypothetical protein EZMO1_2897 [Endozoicomonas montiporae CL-33]KEQ15377.1 hypothetical protein GZ77_01640 [Endozoicomonas montiporae]
MTVQTGRPDGNHRFPDGSVSHYNEMPAATASPLTEPPLAVTPNGKDSDCPESANTYCIGIRCQDQCLNVKNLHGIID